jgi:hypothetical protein
MKDQQRHCLDYMQSVTVLNCLYITSKQDECTNRNNIHEWYHRKPSQNEAEGIICVLMINNYEAMFNIDLPS